MGATGGPKTVFELVETINVMDTERTESDDEFDALNKNINNNDKQPKWDHDKCKCGLLGILSFPLIFAWINSQI